MPETLSYETHRYFPRLTVIGTGLVLVALIGFVLRWFGLPTTGLAQVALTFAVFVLLVISRAYTTALQDRIIRLEMQLRCERLLSAEQRGSLDRLTKAQLVALRFASDPELGPLLDRAVRESLSGEDIKRAIRTWVPDDYRT